MQNIVEEMEIRKRHQREVCEALRLHGDDGLRRSGRLGKPGATAGGRRIGLPVVASLAEQLDLRLWEVDKGRR